MIIIFGKGKVGNSLNRLLDKLNLKNILMDDKDWDDDLLSKSKKIICSPGIKKNHKLYLNYGDKVFSELNFLGDIIKKKGLENKLEFIGITGTNGKSTSVHIMYNLFKGIFKKLKINTKVHLSGNFGTPLSDTIYQILDDKKNKEHLIILEVSSFMLYKLNNFSFDYSILTNLGVDHLDWHTDIKEYFDSKFNLIRYTKKYITTSNDVIEKYKQIIKKSDTKTFEHTRIEPYKNEFDLDKTKFLGEHNKGNWNAIYKVIWKYFDNKKIKRNEKVFWNVVGGIEPLEHRMKLVKTINGIKIYDDGICTSSQALNAALSCFEDKIILIAGGYDKGEEYVRISDELQKKVEFMCLIGQTAKKFKKICKEKNIEYKIFDSLQNAVKYSINKAKELKIKSILFSPGSASFDMFKNVYDRCDKFSKIIDNL
ncbi:MAG TPA: UDP-N-acetylmuramoyl-L-alanine--D-glutamate ligase [Candidatus Absconditabacterales bacterium]|nr:UDP-N-acetylmuramoyl-L-alanine--D-glutamate ligase [Candidatus Absconditabacterales bacterium]